LHMLRSTCWPHIYRIQCWLCMLLSPIALFVIGSLVEKFFIRRVHSFGLVYDLLLTFGLGYAMDEMVKWIWGTMPLDLNLTFATRSITVFSTTYPVYRIFILGISILVIGMLILILFKTNIGIIHRANALGINIPILFNGVFAFGAALAALAGVVAAPLFTVSTDLASLVLIDGFVVVILGGLGSLGGAILSSFLIGQLQSFGSLLMPQISMIFIYVLMAVVLVFRPSGLLGNQK
jgi:branched-chain amino acid transport system permease protein